MKDINKNEWCLISYKYEKYCEDDMCCFCFMLKILFVSLVMVLLLYLFIMMMNFEKNFEVVVNYDV